MFEAVFKALSTGLSLWKTKQSRKYLDELIDLKQDWYDEYSKEISDDDVLARIELRLCIIVDGFASQVGASASKDS